MKRDMPKGSWKPAWKWADEIALLPSREERRKAVAAVPTNLQPLVKTHLRNMWEKKKFAANQGTE